MVVQPAPGRHPVIEEVRDGAVVLAPPPLVQDPLADLWPGSIRMWPNLTLVKSDEKLFSTHLLGLPQHQPALDVLAGLEDAMLATGMQNGILRNVT